MQKVICGNCGKRYAHDQDGFCPYCGAFNQPGAVSDAKAQPSGSRKQDRFLEKRIGKTNVRTLFIVVAVMIALIFMCIGVFAVTIFSLATGLT